MKNRDDIPSASDFGKLRAYLARKGVSQQQIKAAIGNSVGGRSRETIANELRDWMKTL